jgi:hypothetical protein
MRDQSGASPEAVMRYTRIPQAVRRGLAFHGAMGRYIAPASAGQVKFASMHASASC